MNQIKVSLFFSICIIVFSLGSCSKGEGKGGGATIKGKILVQEYATGTITNGTPYAASNEKVYLIYGDGTTYSESFSTSYDGSFEFSYLRKGNYKVFVYSDIVPSPANPPYEEAKIVDVVISDKKGEVELETITIKKY